MVLMSTKILKERFSGNKNKKDLQSKKLEGELVLELEDMLAEYLEDNDQMLIEVDAKVISEFVNIIDKKLALMYECEQIESNKFIFRNKELQF